MKITIVLGPFQPLPPMGIGAVEKVWYDLSREFGRLGHDVLLIGKCERTAASIDAVRVKILPLRGYKASGRLWRDLLSDLLYAVEVSRKVEFADVIVTNSFFAPLVLSLLPRRGKIVVHVARFPKGQMWLYRRVDALHAISSAIATEITRQTPALRDRVWTQPYPVDLTVFHPPSMARQFNGESTILYIGRVHPEKGIDLLIQAFRMASEKLPRARLRIVGPHLPEQGGGGAAWLDALRQSAIGLQVEFVGPIADPGKLSLELQRAHCFCYPSLAEKGEAFGLAVLEAMATGLTVAVSDLACFSDMVERGHDGLVFDHRQSESAAALAAILIEILSDEKVAARLGNNASTKAREFALSKIASRYILMFEAICKPIPVGRTK